MSTPVKPELWGLQLMLKAPEVGKALQGVVATRPARQMRASGQNWCAIPDAMAQIQTPDVLAMTRLKYKQYCRD